MLTRRRFTLSLVVASALPAMVRASTLDRVEYAYGAHRLQCYDHYPSPQTNRPAPAIVMVHGGAWRIGDKRNPGVWREKYHHWHAKGYAFLSVNYRMLPEADPFEQAEDVARALAHIQKNARQLGIDPTRIVLMGHSAGAHLISLLAASPVLAHRHGANPWRVTIPLDTAALDVEQIMTTDPARLYRKAFGSTPAFWRKTSPAARLTGQTGPFLLVCSNTRSRPCPAATDFAQKVTRKGGTARVLPVSLSHSAINRDLGRPGPYTAAIDRFLNRHGLP